MNHKQACRVFLGGLLVLFLSSGMTQAGYAAEPLFHVAQIAGFYGPQPLYVPGELLVRFQPAMKIETKQVLLNRYHTTMVRPLLLPDVSLVRFDPMISPVDMAATLRRDPTVRVAEPNYYRYAEFSPNDTYYSYQWDLPAIQMTQAWEQSNGHGVTVAVIDTGVAYETYDVYVQAPDLAGTTFVPGWDFVNNDAHPNDDNAHGTHVTGTIAQTTNNNLGVAGMAYQAQIMPIKVLNNKGSGSDLNVADGIVWATDHGAQVINLSLGGATADVVLELAVDYAYSHGVLVVAAAGNDSCKGVDYPAAYPHAVAVAAVRFDQSRAYYSNCGPEIDLAAPGGDVTVDQNGDGYIDGILQQTFSGGNYGNFGYWFYQGTSMATPHVTAAAALLIAQGYATTPDAVRSALVNTALDLGTAGHDNEYGWGLIQVNDALTYAASTTVTPTATRTATPTPTASHTATPTPTVTRTATPTPTASHTATPTPTVSRTATPTPTATPSGCTLAGDLNCDCVVDIIDIMAVAGRWETGQGDPNYNPSYDFDGNGKIDVLDIMYVATRFQNRCG